MSENLWLNINIDDSIEDNHSIEFLKEQALFLEEKTNGRVKASFTKFGVHNDLTESDNKDSIELDTKKEDFNDRFKKIKYQFEIHNDKYHYRVFTLENSIEFPVTIIIDEDICHEEQLDRRIEIFSNQQLKSVIGKVFASRKVRTVISRMQTLSSQKQEATSLTEARTELAKTIASIPVVKIFNKDGVVIGEVSLSKGKTGVSLLNVYRGKEIDTMPWLGSVASAPRIRTGLAAVQRARKMKKRGSKNTGLGISAKANTDNNVY